MLVEGQNSENGRSSPSIYPKSLGRSHLNTEDFIYLGSWIDGTERDIKDLVRKGSSTQTEEYNISIWKSNLF